MFSLCLAAQLLWFTWTHVTELSDVDVMLSLVADGIVEHTAVGVVILIFHLQR